MIDWSNERFIKVYTRDTADWMTLSFDAQALFLLILRKVNRAGRLELGRHGTKAVAVAVGHGPIWTRLEPALHELLADGCIQITSDNKTLLVRNFEEAQEARKSNAQRQRDFKENRKQELKTAMPDGQTGFVYFVRSVDGGPIKIGFASDPKSRLDSMQVGRADVLVMLACMPGTLEDEKALHARFASSHSRGEWFEPCDELMSVINNADNVSLPSLVTGGNEEKREVTPGNSSEQTRSEQTRSESQKGETITTAPIGASALPEAPRAKPASRKKQQLLIDQTPPEPGTAARAIFDAITTDPIFGRITEGPADFARRIANPETYPGVNVLAEVRRAMEHASRGKRAYTDGRRMLSGWLRTSAQEAALRAPPVPQRPSHIAPVSQVRIVIPPPEPTDAERLEQAKALREAMDAAKARRNAAG